MISFPHCGGRRFFHGWLSLIAVFVALGAGGPPAEAQRRLPPRPIPYSELDRQEGEQRLAEMREMGMEGVYSFLFDLRVMPRRGEEEVFRGQMWGSRNRAGPLFRYEIWKPGQREERSLRFLVQNGVEPVIWMLDTAEPDAEVRKLDAEALFTRIQGTDFTPFDLQMPFIYWEDFAYEGLRRVRGRSSHGFLMYPPDDIREEFPWLEGVRMFLDAEFNALTGAELVNARGKVLRSFNIIEIKRIDDEWIVKSIDYRDRRTGDKTRLSIGGAALDLSEEPFDFSPDALERPFPELSRDRFNLF